MVSEKFRALLRRLQKEVVEAQRIITVGSGIMARLAVMRRCEEHIIACLEKREGFSDKRITDAVEETFSILSAVRREQVRFFKAERPYRTLRERVHALYDEDGFDPACGRKLLEDIEVFKGLFFSGAYVEKVREQFLALSERVRIVELEVAAERAAKVLKPVPAVRKSGKAKSARALNDAALRAAMRGLSTGKPPKGTSNPKKAAKRAKKARARGESVASARQ